MLKCREVTAERRKIAWNGERSMREPNDVGLRCERLWVFRRRRYLVKTKMVALSVGAATDA